MSRYAFNAKRLHVNTPLTEGGRVAADRQQINYLANVLRLSDGDAVLLFNGEDGEWRASLAFDGRKKLDLVLTDRVRPQTPSGSLELMFAPLKQARLDYMIEKATEMGVGSIRPVLTTYTQNRKLNMDKMQAYVVEAAQQCGILALPRIEEPDSLEVALDTFDDDRILVFCDEDVEPVDPAPALRSLRHDRITVLIGPEGGFAASERERLNGIERAVRLSLGPRILRADTAAVAALALVQSHCGDWYA